MYEKMNKIPSECFAILCTQKQRVYFYNSLTVFCKIHPLSPFDSIISKKSLSLLMISILVPKRIVNVVLLLLIGSL